MNNPTQTQPTASAKSYATSAAIPAQYAFATRDTLREMTPYRAHRSYKSARNAAIKTGHSVLRRQGSTSTFAAI